MFHCGVIRNLKDMSNHSVNLNRPKTKIINHLKENYFLKKLKYFLYTRYPIVAHALGLAAA